MLQAKHRRVLWLLLLIWLQLLHSRLLEKLMDASFRSLQLGSAPGEDLRTLLSCFWLAGALCMVLWQFGSYQRFRRKALESMKPVEESWMRSACEQAALEGGSRRQTGKHMRIFCWSLSEREETENCPIRLTFTTVNQ